MNCEPLSYLPQGERILLLPSLGGGGGGYLILFPLRGNFVTLKGCKKIMIFFVLQVTTLTLRSTNKSLTFLHKYEKIFSGRLSATVLQFENLPINTE